MTERAIRLVCGQDTLLGVFHPAAPTHDPSHRRAVLFLVGGPQYRVGSHRQFVIAARFLAAAGFPVLRFDFRGMGDSEGEAPGFENVQHDVGVAIDALFGELPGLRSICVFGLCDAASAALLHCCRDPRVDSLILANPWVRTEAGQAAALVKHYYGNRLLQRSFWAKLFKGGLNPISSMSGLLDSIRTSRHRASTQGRFVDRMLAGLRDLRGPVLLLSSGQDLTAREFDDLCSSDRVWKSLIRQERVRRVDLPATDHTFSDRAGLDAANAAVLDFLRGTSSTER